MHTYTCLLTLFQLSLFKSLVWPLKALWEVLKRMSHAN